MQCERIFVSLQNFLILCFSFLSGSYLRIVVTILARGSVCVKIRGGGVEQVGVDGQTTSLSSGD